MSENCAKVIRIITLPQVLVFFLILLLGDQIPPWHHEMAIVLLCVVPLISYLYWHISPELREQGRKSQRKLAIIFSVIGCCNGFSTRKEVRSCTSRVTHRRRTGGYESPNACLHWFGSRSLQYVCCIKMSLRWRAF